MAHSPGEPLIDSQARLQELADHLRRCGRFALDTEFISEDTFEPVLCLIQVATPERLAVVDPLALENLSPFWNVATDPAVEVVMHAAGEDLRICRFQTGTVPRRLFDVQIAAGLVGFGYPLSHSSLIRQALGTTLAGGETRTDWRRRPLSPAQLQYALDDVRHLLGLADRIRAELARLGRTSWAEAEMEAALDAIRNRSDEERWRRLPGLQHLNRRGLEAARRLADWRIETARRTNWPVRRVLRDDLLVAIAKRLPAHRSDLEALRDFNRPNLLRYVPQILSLIVEAQAVPIEALPEHADRHEERPGLSMVVNVLSASLARCCAQQGVAVGLVGTTADLKDLARWYLEGQPDTHRPALAQGWRSEVCGQTLLDVLSGRVALRIADLNSEVPVRLDPASAGPSSAGC
jgi:ribonuclease D